MTQVAIVSIMSLSIQFPSTFTTLYSEDENGSSTLITFRTRISHHSSLWHRFVLTRVAISALSTAIASSTTVGSAITASDTSLPGASPVDPGILTAVVVVVVIFVISILVASLYFIRKRMLRRRTL